MIDIQKELHDFLVTNVPSVQNRVSPLHLPQHNKGVSITYQILHSSPIRNLSGCDDTYKIRVQINVWSKHYAELKATSRELQDVIRKFKKVVSYDVTELYETETELYTDIVNVMITLTKI